MAWKYRVDLSAHWTAECGFKAQKDGIVRVLRESDWLRDQGDLSRCGTPTLAEAVQVLGAAKSTAEFNAAMNDLWDIADADRAWLEH